VNETLVDEKLRDTEVAAGLIVPRIGEPDPDRRHNISSAWQESDGSWSWARLAATVTLLSSVYGFIYVVIHSHIIPDPLTLVGLSTWGVSPYGVNKVVALLKKDSSL
jgi:hypothetical protein